MPINVILSIEKHEWPNKGESLVEENAVNGISFIPGNDIKQFIYRFAQTLRHLKDKVSVHNFTSTLEEIYISFLKVLGDLPPFDHNCTDVAQVSISLQYPP